jgi:hypothetical protein
MTEIADMRERLREEWLRKATSSFTCQECGIQANFIDEIIDALDTKDKRIAELSGGWQPIESAPKDGTRILVCAPGWEIAKVTHYHPQSWQWANRHKPTLWQPLPAPPSRIDKEDRNG